MSRVSRLVWAFAPLLMVAACTEVAAPGDYAPPPQSAAPGPPGRCNDDVRCTGPDAGIEEPPDATPPEVPPPPDEPPGEPPPTSTGGSGTCGVEITFGTVDLVVFSDPQGALIGTAVPDASGLALRHDCVPDTMVTFESTENPASSYPNWTEALITITGLQDDQVTRFPYPYPEMVATVVATSSADVSALDQTPGYYQLRVGATHMGYSAGATMGTSSTNFGLGTDGYIDVMALARTSAYGEPLGFAYYTMVPSAPGIQYVTLSAWEPPDGSIDVSLSSTESMQLSAELRQGRDRRSFLELSRSASIPTGGSAQLSYPALPWSFADVHTLNLQRTTAAGGVLIEQQVFLQRAASSSHDVDVDAHLPTPITAVASSPGDFGGMPLLTWTFSAPVPDTDAIMVELSRSGQKWYVMAPDPAQGQLQLPYLPTSLLAQGAGPFSPSAAVSIDADYVDYPTILDHGVDFTQPFRGWALRTALSASLESSLRYARWRQP